MSNPALDQRNTRLNSLPVEKQRDLQSLRANALEKILCGLDNHDIVDEIIIQIESWVSGPRLIVFAHDSTTLHLSLFSYPSIPIPLSTELKNLPIIDQNNHCGVAYFSQEEVVVSDLFAQAKYVKLKELAKNAKIHTCYSFPIFQSDGECIGAIDTYADSAEQLDKNSILLIRACTDVIGTVLERGQAFLRQKLVQHMLTDRVEEQQKDLHETHEMVAKALSQRDEVRKQLVDIESTVGISTMLASIIHEMNTPIGVALTAVTYLQKLGDEFSAADNKGKSVPPNQLGFIQKYGESCAIASRNLTRASTIIDIYKQLTSDKYHEKIETIHFTDYVGEILLSLRPLLKTKLNAVCLNVNADMAFPSYPAAIGQLLANLLLHSVQHSFEDLKLGHVTIEADVLGRNKSSELFLTYADNGKGMDKTEISSLYRPFFDQARNKAGTGLGMHICYNLAVNVLRGSIDCESKPNQGTKFTLRIPLSVND